MADVNTNRTTDSILQGNIDEKLASVSNALNSNTDAISELAASIKTTNSAVTERFREFATQLTSVKQDTGRRTRSDSGPAYARDDNTVNKFLREKASVQDSALNKVTTASQLERKRDLDWGFSQIKLFVNSSNKIAALGQIGKNAVARRVGTTVSGFAAGTVGAAGLAGSLAGGAALTAGIVALTAVVSQGVKLLKENLSYTVLAGNYLGARKGEAVLGNFTSEDDRQFKFGGYQSYRNRMRLMGARDDAQVAANIQGLFGTGIGGGVGRADAVSGALSRQAVQSVFGVQVSDAAMSSLYRGSRGSDTGLLSEGGAFNVEKAFQRLASVTKQTANEFGSQAGFSELYSIFDELKDNFRGVNNDFGSFIYGLGTYGSLLSDNILKQNEVVQLHKLSQTTNADQQFKMLAFAGVPGNNILEARMKFMQQGVSAQGSQENAKIMAKSVQNFAANVHGTAGVKDFAIRSYLEEGGLGNIAKSVANPLELFNRVASGDKNAERELRDTLRDEKAVLEDTARKLDMIQDPLSHIRDLLFEQSASTFQGVEEKLAKGALMAAQVAIRATGGSIEQADKYGELLKGEREKERGSGLKDSLALTELLKEIANNTETTANGVNKNNTPGAYIGKNADAVVGRR